MTDECREAVTLRPEIKTFLLGRRAALEAELVGAKADLSRAFERIDGIYAEAKVIGNLLRKSEAEV